MHRRLFYLAVIMGAVAAPAARAQQVDWSAVEQAFGRKGQAQPGDVYRFNMPRSDLAVTVQGVRIRPALSLGSWVAFKPTGANEAVAMGDLVLTEAELNRVISRLEQGGVGLMGVHKHLPQMTPPVWWTHIHAHGNPVEIARTLKEALALSGTPTAAPAPAPAAPSDLDTAAVARALGRSGKVNGGVYQVSVPRAEAIRSMGTDVPAAMGTATAINFQPTGGGKAAVNGDFVMTAGEIDPVVQALRANGIEVVSLHNHMTDDEPRLFFMHFWANDDAVKLARGLKAALDRTNSKPAS
jgi:hypothetical protein